MTAFREEAPDISDIRYPKLTSDILQKGILYGLEKNEKYHLEYYSGTYYAASDMTADIHIYSPKEYYHTNRYRLLQGTLFEIQLPVLEDGIYSAGTALGVNRKPSVLSTGMNIRLMMISAGSCSRREFTESLPKQMRTTSYT